MNKLMTTMLLLAGLGLLAGCGDTHYHGYDYEYATPEEACEDWADVLASKASACGEGSYYEWYDDLSWDCYDVDAIRDRYELYEECLPELEYQSCYEFRRGYTPYECTDQFIYY